MELLLKRNYLKEWYTIGSLFIDGKFFSDTLEDKRRDLSKEPKIPGKTAIPEGKYKVIMSYSNRFKRIMPEILNVPNFTGIRLHSGTTDASTEGCPLVGRNTAKGVLTESRAYSDKLNSILEGVKDGIWITVA